MIETSKRSLMKAISWRIIGTIDTFIISWIISGKAIIAGSIASIEVLTKVSIYWMHERAWNKLNWGKNDQRN